MERRPSVISVSSLGSISGLLKPVQLNTLPESLSQTHSQNGTSLPLTSKQSMNGKIEPLFEANLDAWDPDEVFTKHTVAEVKVIQQRLRSDADAKQEELRVMVGERYRDLLQASTSIISIAESSKHVVSTLDAMRRVGSSAGSAHSQKASLSGQGDSHLQTLQSLAAHMKLLLDAPEHLWRLLERKMYLHAAWLFLLSRVVHRSLLRDHDEDDATWVGSGIDINEQFPLVQRQWDAVSQFRSQIAHKATLSLRESSSTAVEVCATLLTLHLLESRPLHETLATFLAQRSKTLSSALHEQLESIPNGTAGGTSKPKSLKAPLTSRKVVVRELRQRLKVVLEVVSRTLGIARTIFIGVDGESPSLMQQVLDHIQTDDPQSAANLPAELRLTSQSLLSSLPSSNHFLLLPSNVRLYKPYVDGASLATPDSTGQLLVKLDDWSHKAMQQVQKTLESWFVDLQTIREVWQIRKWSLSWIRIAGGLQTQERTQLKTILDDICKKSATSMWKSALDSVAASFRERLEESLSHLERSDFDIRPIRYLFRATPEPTIQGSNLSVAKASFEKFKSTLQRQLVCRTPLLDEVLSATETQIRSLHDDVYVIHEDDGHESSIAADLISQFGEDAVVLCTAVSEALSRSLQGVSDDTELSMLRINFLGRIASELSASTAFYSCLECDSGVVDGIRNQLKDISKSASSLWQKHITSKVLEEYWTCVSVIPDIKNDDPRPSAALINCLLALANSLLEVGTSVEPAQQSDWACRVLTLFTEEFLATMDQHPAHQDDLIYVWDIAFLQKVATSWGSQMEDVGSKLHTRMLEMLAKPKRSSPPHAGFDMSECLSRMQHLLGVLLPAASSSRVSSDRSPSLLQLGSPSSENHHHPAIHLVKPSARFGLLLVGSSFAR